MRNIIECLFVVGVLIILIGCGETPYKLTEAYWSEGRTLYFIHPDIPPEWEEAIKSAADNLIPSLLTP